MAVTKTLTVLIVLAITCNQGAARPADSGPFLTKNDLTSAEGKLQMDSDGDITFGIPTIIKKDLVITISGTINPNDTTLIVELPSLSGKESCQIKYEYMNKNEICITPAVKDFEKTEYSLSVTPGSLVGPTFTLAMMASVDRQNREFFSMTFRGNDDSDSSPLICKIENFNDINTIVVKRGVTHVNSLLFEFGKSH